MPESMVANSMSSTQTYPTSPLQQATTTRASQPAPAAGHHPLSAPASQESFLSVQSAGSSIAPPRLQASDSNLSQITAYTDSDNTSPTSSAGDKTTNNATVPSAQDIQRDRTPENGSNAQHVNGESALASPMSITSPVVTNGTKRTASGHVKNTPSLSSTPYGTAFPGRESRRESISSTSSRAGELAASLKTRLGYAMAKVQHGWEHKSLHEVEQLAAHKVRTNRYSMSQADQQRPSTNGLSNGTARLTMYDQYGRGALEMNGPPPSKRHSGTYTAFTYPAPLSSTSYVSAPHLQPAADIRPVSNHRPYQQPSMGYQHPYMNAMSPPQTPVNAAPRRPPTIRTETQTKDAEMEALQALIGLGSPHTSQIPTSNQASPNRMNLDTPRRVTFARSESDSSTHSHVPAAPYMSSQTEHVNVR